MKQSKKEICRQIFNANDGAHAKGEKKAEILRLFEESGAAKNSAIVYFSQIKHEVNNEAASTDPVSTAVVDNTPAVESVSSVEQTVDVDTESTTEVV